MARSTAMAIRDLQTKLSDTQRGKFASDEDLKKQIDKVAEAVPSWLSVRQTTKGPYVTISRQPLSEVHKLLKERIQQHTQFC